MKRPQKQKPIISYFLKAYKSIIWALSGKSNVFFIDGYMAIVLWLEID
jgi:hypothetical protein